ncbi:MAG: pteridine reductase [Gammaproteobacteria bacterium]
MDNKTILITGAAKRIGAAIARGLHDAEVNIIIHYNTSSDAAKELAEELNGKRPDSACTICADLLDINSHDALISQAFSFKERLDVLINNASVFYETPIEDISETQWDAMMGINLKAPMLLAKHAAPYLAKNNGCIINLADIYAEYPLKNYPIYSISKAGLVMLTKSLAKEFGPEIRVNAISPGAILWPETMSNDTKEAILERTVLKHQGDVEDIVNAIKYLIKNAGYITGQVLTIDGGRTLFS